MSQPKERPILFSGPMVRALLEGRKTQSRRVVKPQPPSVEAVNALCGAGGYGWYTDHVTPGEFKVTGPVWAVRQLGYQTHGLRCPYGQPGDRLWVKESWGIANTCPGGSYECREDWVQVGYKANPDPYDVSDPIPRPAEEVQREHARLVKEIPSGQEEGFPRAWRWRGPRFMPQWASRLTLEVTEVRVEQLQKMTPDDARAEAGGVVGSFTALWDSINEKRGYSWQSNPWVWVLCFKVVHP